VMAWRGDECAGVSLKVAKQCAFNAQPQHVLSTAQ
jgi:hypothetical protein